MSDEQKCLFALAETRAYLRERAPYICTTVYGLVPHFAPGLQTLGVTRGLVLAVDPEWFSSLTLELRAGCIMHECMHILRGLQRLERMPDKDLANQAFDLPINHDLREAGWQLPEWALYPEKFKFEPGLTGEQYYELLEQQKKKAGKDGSSDGSGQGKICAGKCGGSAGGHFDEKLEKELDAQYGRPGADVERIRKSTFKAIEDEAKRGGGGRGSMPASLREYLEFDQQTSVVPWRTKLARVLRRATGRIVSGRNDFSMARPSKRSYSRGIIRPGLIDRKMTIAFIEDSSGSMGKEQLKSARVEAAAVMKQIGLDEAWFMDADAAVSAPPRIVRMRDIHTIPVHGGGGTNFIPALQVAQKLKPKPDVVIYLTDGDGVAPKRAPKNMEVIWCVVPSNWGRRPAWWGHLVVVDDNGQELNPPLEYDHEDEGDAA